ncbi:siroheme synthase [Thalassotalea litorea]|uniref:siroheme synthase n=1 Tax=Thalassotalea litorea TaxID=2020715 RepID=UPI003736AB99
MQYFPIFLDSDKLSVVIIGGGSVAARKIELVCKTSANVRVVSPEINQTVEALIRRHNIDWQQTCYDNTQIKDANLVIAATNDSQVNAQISEDAKALNILVNVVDAPQLCSYITPAIIDREPMLIALSSSGSAPILLQMLKTQIEQVLPNHYGKLAQFCGSKRHQVQQYIDDFATRKVFWQETLTGDIAQLILADDLQLAQQRFEQRLQSYQRQNVLKSGDLSIVVSQDNNPDLLTLAAYQVMQLADTIYLEPHLDRNFYEFARRDSEKAPRFDIDEIHKTVASGQRVVVITDNPDRLTQQGLKNARVYSSGRLA